MLLKIPRFLKNNFNVCEIYLHEFWFQNTKHFWSCKDSNFEFSFLYSIMSILLIFLTKRCVTLLLVNILLPNLFQRVFTYEWRNEAKMTDFAMLFWLFLSLWKWQFHKGKCQKVEFLWKALYSLKDHCDFQF